MPEILSQHHIATLEEESESKKNKSGKLKEHEREENVEDRNDKDDDDENHNYGHLNESATESKPRFKHPNKLYSMEMKPAGSSMRLRCAAEGNNS